MVIVLMYHRYIGTSRVTYWRGAGGELVVLHGIGEETLLLHFHLRTADGGEGRPPARSGIVRSRGPVLLRSGAIRFVGCRDPFSGDRDRSTRRPNPFPCCSSRSAQQHHPFPTPDLPAHSKAKAAAFNSSALSVVFTTGTSGSDGHGTLHGTPVGMSGAWHMAVAFALKEGCNCWPSGRRRRRKRLGVAVDEEYRHHRR